MPRGGKREGAGAPKGNLNAFKHGQRSRQLNQLGATIAASPSAREALLKLAERDAAQGRKADELAAHIVAEVLRRGLARGEERLIVLPDVLDGHTIKELTGSTVEKLVFRHPQSNAIQKPTVNQKNHTSYRVRIIAATETSGGIMENVKLPTGPQDVTPDWLTAALRESGVLSGDVAVTAAKAEVIGEGVGVLGQLARFGMTYSSETAAPASLIGKFPGAAEENRALANMFRFYEREVNFYERIAGQVELRTPRRYYSHFDDATKAFVLLIEDMAPVDCIDQLKGCSITEAATAVMNMAPFHATWWGKVDTPDLDWIPYVNDPVQQIAGLAYNNGWEGFVRNFGDRLSPEEMAIAERFRTGIIGAQNALRDRPCTIVHGDLRCDNMFFDSDGSMTLCDWQIVQRAPAAYDIGYFMSQSMDPADRKACEMDLLRDYHGKLEQYGVEGYTFDQLLEDYRLSAMYCLVYPVISGGMLDLANQRGTGLVSAMLDRSMATVRDLSCDERIPV